MQKKIMLSVAFLLSLSPMLLSQYGGMRGVQEITGLINLLNPIGLISVALFFAGVWEPLKKQSTGKLLGAVGVIGIVVAEVYQFFTWHYVTITGKISIQHSLQLAFPEFYFGLLVSLAMVIAYFLVQYKLR